MHGKKQMKKVGYKNLMVVVKYEEKSQYISLLLREWFPRTKNTLCPDFLKYNTII